MYDPPGISKLYTVLNKRFTPRLAIDGKLVKVCVGMMRGDAGQVK